MCGRFVSSSSPDELADYFGVDAVADAVLEPNYNVAPTNDVYAVVEDAGTRYLDAFFWGLVPSWAKDPKIGSRMINARAETLAEKNAFKRSFATRRCIIPADGFYEWRKIDGQKKKQPMYMTAPDHAPLAFAGLWSVWRGGGDDEPLRSVTIITTTPNETMAPIHDRMPVVLPPDRWATWLDRDNHDLAALQPLLVPAPNDAIVPVPVSTEVNSVRNNGLHLTTPLESGEVLN